MATAALSWTFSRPIVMPGSSHPTPAAVRGKRFARGKINVATRVRESLGFVTRMVAASVTTAWATHSSGVPARILLWIHQSP